MKNPNPQELSFWTAMYSEPVNRSQLSQLSQHNELEEAVEKREVWPSLRRLLPCDSDLDKWQKMDVWMAFGTVHTLTYYVLSLKPNLVFQGWLCRGESEHSTSKTLQANFHQPNNVYKLHSNFLLILGHRTHEASNHSENP